MIRVLVFVIAVTGQAEMETPAQKHVGHVATAMNGTPDGVGLAATMEAEAKIAAQHAALAAKDLTSLEGMQRHVKHVRHAIDPSTEEKGPGQGYGLSRAADGVSKHIELAARSDGATKQIETHATHVSTSAKNVVKWSALILAECDKVLAAETAEAAAGPMQRIAELTQHVLEGTDADEDGKIGWQDGEGGVAQAKAHLGFLMATS